jgi:peptide/nickel transport system substrate-binding protein
MADQRGADEQARKESVLSRLPGILTVAVLSLALVGGTCVGGKGASVALAQTTVPAPSIAMHGIAMHGNPALPRGFTHLPHVNPDAPKGGQLRLAAPGTFDNLNPFIIRGNTPQGLREYVFESLMARAADEPFTLYGLIASGIETPADRSSVTFHLRPEARFSDGRPITAEDVVFSHRVLSEKGWPYHRSHYKKVTKVEVLSPHRIRFDFGGALDRELPLILGLMPVLPRHRFDFDTFERTTLEPLVGSGPFVIAKVDPGRSITYRRNPQYWGRDLPVHRGRYNFDEVSYELFRDQGAMFEAFKAGDIDARVEDEPARWAEGYDFPAVRNGHVLRREVIIGQPAGMSALVFNSRRPPFDDQRVRRAFIELLDAEWINKSLFHGLYRRTTSFFARSDLAASGRPADARERELLARFPRAVSPDIMEGRPFLPVTDGSGSNRAGLARANKLFNEAGYHLVGGRMVSKATGKPLAFEFLASSRTQERLVLAFGDNLKRLGIAMRIRQVDSAQYWGRMKSFDFDMAQWNWGVSLSPGNEQINRWSSRAAENEGTLNYAGVRNPAVDAMIEEILKAEAREHFVSAVRAFDRALLSGDYVIPLFHVPGQWLAWRRRVAFPERVPLTGVDFDTWWAVR